MASLNQCNFIGNLGKDPELGYYPSGDPYVNFSIACTEKWKDKNSGEAREKTEWIPLVASGKTAEFIAKYCAKGTSVHIEGKFTTRSWEKDGKTQYKSEIRVEKFQILSGGVQAGASNSAPPTAPAPRQAAAPRPAAGRPAPNFAAMDDDIPF